MLGITQADWTTWIQTLTGVVAFLFAPAGLQALWNKLRHRFTARCTPERLHKSGGATHWTIEIKNRSRLMRPLEARIYPRRPGNIIRFASIDSVNDGGFEVQKADSSSGSLELHASRIAPNRSFFITVVFAHADLPDAHGDSNKIYLDVDYRDKGERIIRHGVLSIMRLRLMMLLLNFGAATVVIVGILAFYGFKS